MVKRKYAAVAVIFGNTADRYVIQGYTEPRTFEQMLDDATKVKGLTGIELVGGWHVNDQNQNKVVKLIQDKGLKIAMLIPEIWANPKWGWGTLTSNDPGIRRDAIERIKVAMDLAKKTGCNQVSPWFGHDGWDYVFQADYAKVWDYLIDGVTECAEYLPDVKIALEYKMKEPRTHAFMSDLGKMLLLVQAVNKPSVGINLDVGHALLGYESMAECVALLDRFGHKLFHLHMNDNYRLWDDDMIPGSVHTLEFIEFFYWIDRIGYDGWLSLDVFAYRERDKIAVAKESIAWLETLSRISERLDRKKVEAVLKSGDAMKAQKLVREAMFG